MKRKKRFRPDSYEPAIEIDSFNFEPVNQENINAAGHLVSVVGVAAIIALLTTALIEMVRRSMCTTEVPWDEPDDHLTIYIYE